MAGISCFGNHILKREAFLWADLSSEEISNMTGETLLHLLTIRRNSAGDQCDLCGGENVVCLIPASTRFPDSQMRSVSKH
jgi:hypothetical protein